ncbi:hypothetical protein [uncultured Jatrophihabitans sp.]|uniref:hypothetical protein n=1 Tax=uncultured Jatrophihabitans sp. TaxID=1610747 RepID=UPI0035CB037F
MALLDLTRRGPVFAVPWRDGRDPDTDAECFVSHTVFAYDRWRDLPQIGLAARRAAQLFSRHEGSVVLAQWFLPGRRLMGDLSVWRSETHLRDFLVDPAHVELVARWRGLMHGVHHSWTAPVDRDAIWARAVPLMRSDGRPAAG